MKPAAFGLLPTDYRACPNDPGFVFERVQRVAEWSDEGPVLGKEGRAYLEGFDLSLPEIVSATTSSDDATKFVLRFADGKLTECVHMPRDVKSPRVTLCISSQVGCGMGCTFCATAGMGFVRQLTAAEIVAQVLTMLRARGPATLGRVSIVFMGMGEPLHNFAEVMRAVNVLAHPRGLGIAPSRMTVSTSGLVPQIDALGSEPVRPQLAISMNATTDETRARLMPVGKTWNLAALREALVRFPFRPHEKLTIEYVLLRGENDTLEDAERLATFATGFRHNVNVIPFNAFEGAPYAEPEEETTRAFVDRLHALGSFVTVRKSRGRDVAAACGQLVQLTQKREKRGAVAR